MQPRVVRFRLARLAATLVPLLCVGVVAPAAEIPTDTNAIETLTPADARRLVADFPAEGVPVEFSPANGVSTAFNGLPLNGLKSLDAETAAALAGYQGQLVLGGLTELVAATAKALTSGNAFEIYLHGLTALDAETAAALVKFKGQGLALGGLATLDPEGARVIATFPGGCLTLGLPKLGTEIARMLADYQGRCLALVGLTTLDEETAGRLAKFQGGSLSLEGLAVIDIPQAEALADYKGRLVLSDSCRAGFLEHELSPETARLVADMSGGILPNVTALDSPDSVAIARGLAAYRGPLALPNLKKLSPKTLAVLIEKKDLVIPLFETLELIPETDGSPTEDFVIPEDFHDRQRSQRSHEE